MKKPGRHPEKALTAVQVRALKEPGRHADGNGLYLEVDPSGARRWLLRIMVHGRRRDIGLGSARLVSLAEAREKASAFRKTARDGGDPIADRSKAKLVVPTFTEAAETVHTEHKASWENEKHVAQWITTIRTYVNPLIGNRPVDQIETPDVLRVLSPIWLTKQETARRVRQRIGAVLNWAKAAGFRSGDNPVDGVTKGLPKQQGAVEHHAALPYAEVPAFMTKLRAVQPPTLGNLAFQLLILTALRTSEVIGGRWQEIDEENALWIIPPERMKKRREHRVPLSPNAIQVLNQTKALASGSAFIFPAKEGKKPLSNMVFAMTLRRMKLAITAHGFRSSFRDWAAETTNSPRDVVEMALAHVIADKVEAAYRRGDLLAKRRELMEEWACFCTRSK